MHDEYIALLANHTWDLVPPPSNRKIIHCKYKVKQKSDGSIDRFKARLVAQGCSQQEGIYCNATFSLVIKPITIRVVMSITIPLHWATRQLEDTNAFLHSYLDEEFYMIQPPGFHDPMRSHYVCRLCHFLYGLKQELERGVCPSTHFYSSLVLSVPL